VGDIKTIFNFIYFYILIKQTKAFISKTFDGYETRIQTYLATIYAADTIYEQKVDKIKLTKYEEKMLQNMPIKLLTNHLSLVHYN